MLKRKPQETYEAFREAVRNNEVLEPKTSLLLHLCAAMSVGCLPCMETYLTKALKQGITEEEIGAVQGVAMGISAGRVGAQLREAQKRLKGKM